MALAPRALSLTLLAMLSAAAAPVAAQTETRLQLRWSAPTGCPSTAEVEARVQANLQGSERAAAADNMVVRARVTRRGSRGFLLRVRFSGDLSGERELQAESCQAAADAVVLLVVLAIDPERATRAAAVASNETATAVPNANAPITTATEVAPTERERAEPATEGDAEAEVSDQAPSEADPDTVPTELEVALGAGAAFDTGHVPGATAGLHALAEVAFDRLHLAVSGVWVLPRDKELNAGASLSTGWIGAALDACGLWGGHFSVGPCLGAEAGVLTLSTSGLRDSSGDNPWALFARAAFAARTRLTASLSGALWVGVHTPLAYPRLLVAGETEAFRPTALGVRATLSLLWVIQ